jgi:hypothetical protein
MTLPSLANRFISFNGNRGKLYGETSGCHLIEYLRSIPHKSVYQFKAGRRKAHKLLFLELSAIPNRFGKYPQSYILAAIIYHSDTSCSTVDAYREDIYLGIRSQRR